MTTLLALQPAAAATLARWHEMVSAEDLSNLPTLLAEDVKFRSPAVFKPYSGAPVVNLILNTVLQVFEEFEYHRQFATPDGLNAVLEFNAKVGDKAIHPALINQGAGRAINHEAVKEFFGFRIEVGRLDRGARASNAGDLRFFGNRE